MAEERSQTDVAVIEVEEVEMWRLKARIILQNGESVIGNVTGRNQEITIIEDDEGIPLTGPNSDVELLW